MYVVSTTVTTIKAPQNGYGDEPVTPAPDTGYDKNEESASQRPVDDAYGNTSNGGDINGGTSTTKPEGYESEQMPAAAGEYVGGQDPIAPKYGEETPEDA